MHSPGNTSIWGVGVLPEDRISVCVPVKNNVTLKGTVALAEDSPLFFLCGEFFEVRVPFSREGSSPAGGVIWFLIFRGLFQKLVLIKTRVE